MSKHWETDFPFCNMRKIPRFSSDHNPLIYSNEQETKKTTKPFCFENSWLKHHDFMPKIAAMREKEVKANNSVERWCININRIKKILKGWGQNIEGHNRKYRYILQKELEELEDLEEESNLPANLWRENLSFKES